MPPSDVTEDSDKAFGDAIADLLDDPERRRIMGRVRSPAHRVDAVAGSGRLPAYVSTSSTGLAGPGAAGRWTFVRFSGESSPTSSTEEHNRLPAQRIPSLRRGAEGGGRR